MQKEQALTQELLAHMQKVMALMLFILAHMQKVIELYLKDLLLILKD